MYMFQRNLGLDGHGMQLNLELFLQYLCVLGWKISDQILPNVAMSLGLGDALESWVGISIHSADFKSLEDTIELQMCL